MEKVYLIVEMFLGRKQEISLYMEPMFYLSDLTREGRFLLVEVSIFSGFLLLFI
ncbi:hypothetical protein [Halanaerobium sp. ST460_2HS_T2]|uniref:hypothetical protein n=1 Tax=Halanaerobium sp. ST460_2HS_T2 TaxID=2183914 RepID=UPI001313FE3A|nr:hypothetical protein [Halanaerobium sp. ST460_2HS_T2]